MSSNICQTPISQSFAHIYVFRNSRSLVTAQTWTRVKWFHKLGRADSDKEGWHSSHQSLLFKKTGLTSITCNFEVACENGDTGNLCMSSLPSSGTNDFSLPAQCTVESDLLKDPTGELYKTCRQVPLLYQTSQNVQLHLSFLIRLRKATASSLFSSAHQKMSSRNAFPGWNFSSTTHPQKKCFPALILTQTWIQTIRMPCQLEDLLNIA